MVLVIFDYGGYCYFLRQAGLYRIPFRLRSRSSADMKVADTLISTMGPIIEWLALNFKVTKP